MLGAVQERLVPHVTPKSQLLREETRPKLSGCPPPAFEDLTVWGAGDTKVWVPQITHKSQVNLPPPHCPPPSFGVSRGFWGYLAGCGQVGGEAESGGDAGGQQGVQGGPQRGAHGPEAAHGRLHHQLGGKVPHALHLGGHRPGGMGERLWGPPRAPPNRDSAIPAGNSRGDPP